MPPRTTAPRSTRPGHRPCARLRAALHRRITTD
jgi:hypothetical protein